MAVSLILGGTKTGKTSYAQNIAIEYEKNMLYEIIYIATSKVLDDEMYKRVKKHIESRPKNWQTMEEFYTINGCIDENSGKIVYILDCFTLLLTNHFMVNEGEYNVDDIVNKIKEDFKSTVAKINKQGNKLIVISNQVELGLISTYKLGRDFQDAAGLLHQFIAELSDEVIIMNAGIPVRIK